jgi:hypothetical protein
VNLVGRLDELAAETSERPWRSVHPYGSIITDGASLAHMDEDNRRAYGGGLICESVARADKDFICALVNAWPQIREAAVRAWEYLESLACDGQTPNGDGTWRDCGTCESCRARGAVAVLFQERALAVPERTSGDA